MTIVSCGIVSVHTCYPIIMAAFSSCVCYLYLCWGSKENNNTIYHSLFAFLGQSLVGVVELLRLSIKRFQLIKISACNDLKSINTKHFQNTSKYDYLKLIGIIALVSGLNCGVIILKNYIGSYNVSSKNQTLTYFTSIIIGNIVLSIIMTCLCLPHNIYRHHFISIIVVILGIIPFFISSIYCAINTSDSGFPKSDFLLVIPISLLVSIQQIMEKQLIEKEFISQYFLVTIEGIFGLIVMCIILLLGCPDDFLFWNYILLFSLAYLGMNIFRIVTIIYYTPIHQTIGDSLSIIFNCYIYIQDYIKKLSNGCEYEIAFASIGVVLILIGFAIYFDVLIVYFCKMATHTSKELIKKGETFKTSLVNDYSSFDISDN